ncbi:MAG: hypothetical protein J6U84_02580 [Bacteroidales bacterium]|nr:hypothetical protein [Bacteroidales bacterium]
MAYIMIDLEFIAMLEKTSFNSFKPSERMLISYIYNFKGGYYGSCAHLGEICGLSKDYARRVIQSLKERKILIKERNSLFLNSKYLNTEKTI